MKNLLALILTALPCSASLVLEGGTIDRSGGVSWDAGRISSGFVTPGTPVSVPRAILGSSSLVTIADVIVTRTVGTATVTDFRLDWTTFDPPYDPSVVCGTTDVSKLIPSPGNNKLWTWVGNGSVSITLGAYDGDTLVQTYTVPVTTSSSGGGTTDTLESYAAGSLREHVMAQFNSRLAGKDPNTALDIFSSRNSTTRTYIRSENCWTDGIDLTPLSVWNTTGGYARAGILISPRHVVFATHYQISTGAELDFVTQGNATVTRTLTAKVNISGTDLTIGVLNSDVPESIGFAKVIPDDDLLEKLPGITATNFQYPPNYLKLPMIANNQFKQVVVKDGALASSESSGLSPVRSVAYWASSFMPRSSFDRTIIGGDSGSAVCTVIDGELIALSVHTGPTTGSYIGGAWKTAINAAMTSLGGGYQLTEVNLSAFNSY